MYHPKPPMMIAPYNPMDLSIMRFVDSREYTYHPSYEQLSYTSDFNAWVSNIKALLHPIYLWCFIEDPTSNPQFALHDFLAKMIIYYS